jgi:GNAT superfamily N-acetyltransferase
MGLTFRPLTPDLMDDMGKVLRGGWGAGCWCMHPRQTDSQMRAMKEKGSLTQARRKAMAKLAGKPRAPGLLAFDGEEVAGWIAVAPRPELARIDASKAMPRVDNVDVWVIPCITIRKGERGRGVAVALIRAAADYAFAHGAPAVEAYPRAGSERSDDGNAYFGTEPMFRRAGFKVVRKPLTNLPRTWLPRVTMRLTREAREM